MKPVRLFALLPILALAAPASALIEMKDPVSKVVNSSNAVLVGAISGYDAERHIASVKPFTANKGKAPEAEALQIQISAPESLRGEIKAGQPIVVFVTQRGAVVHVADHWYLAQSLGKPHLFNLRAPDPMHGVSFPGRTAALVKVLDEIKAGKSTLLDAVPDKLFAAPAKAAFTLPANARAFAAIQLPNQDGPTFLVLSDAGLHILGANGAPSKEDLGLKDLKPTLLAAATIGGKPTLLTDVGLYTFDNGAFKKSSAIKLPDDKILALAIDDLNDDGRPAAAILTAKGLHRIPLASLQSDNPGTGADDDTRLVGNKLTEFHRAHEGGFNAATMTAVDLNADHRPTS